MTRKPWGGRFKEGTHVLVERFTESVSFDKRLYEYDIRGSIAHARMLARQGIISRSDARAIEQALHTIKKEIDEGRFEWRMDLEDVHMNIEHALSGRIGEAGKRLHTARSRNDQVATDIRLYLKDETMALDTALKALQGSLLYQAEAYFDHVMPGYTHLQHAQPVLWSHHMLAYFEQFRRDRLRLKDAFERLDVCPLGSAALAGSDFPIDRESVARELGFSRISFNSMDAVSDRDFVAEFIFCASLIMIHLSRLSEELILWASEEFSFVTLPDSFCTGSSIMPQKKNPDCPELIRGKTGRVLGALMTILTILKGLPLTYNRDLQEDKEPLFDTCDIVRLSVEVMAHMLKGVVPKKERLMRATQSGFLTATDLADYLVEKGVPFRSAHEIVGRVVAYCLEEGKELWELTIEELREFSAEIQEDCFDRLSIRGSIAKRTSPGGTAPERVREAMEEAASWLDSYELCIRDAGVKGRGETETGGRGAT